MVLEKLASSGLVETSGAKVNIRYSLRISDTVQTKVIRNNTVIKITDNLKYTEIVIKYAKKNNGRITRRETSSLLGISEDQAYRLLKKMSSEGRLMPAGKGANSYYEVLK